jgi:uncharacterized membrane protein YkvA (DUF1232 family)
MSKNKTITNGQEPDILEEYYTDRPLSDSEIKDLSENLDRKIKNNKRSVLKIFNHLKALKNYMIDKDIKWYRKSVVVAALLYFIAPLDAMPDFAPFVGFLDDIGIIAWTIRFLGKEIRDYYN